MAFKTITTTLEESRSLGKRFNIRYGTLKGTVKYISPSSFNSEQLGSVYLVKLDVDDTNPNVNIMSGLSGSVEVKIGKQSVMRYFLDPIVKGFGESLKEK